MDKVIEDGLMPKPLREAMEQIKTIDDTPRLELTVFLSTFLPMFSNTDGNQDISKWLNVAGNGYNSVEIIDKGKLVHVVPPLFNREVTRLNNHGHESISELSNISEKKKQVVAVLGVEYLRKGLSKRISDPNINHNDVANWNGLLVQYGYEPIELGNLIIDSVIKGDSQIGEVFSDEVDDL